jgi:hypothetical protein
MKNAFLIVTPCGSCKKRFIGTYRLYHEGEENTRDNFLERASVAS